MVRMKKLFFLAVVLMGCGGGGGVDDSKKLSDLSADEAQDLCSEFVDDFPERTVDCSGTMITIGYTAAECADAGEPAPTTCTATVGDARACADATFSLSDDEICNAETLPAACAALQDC